MNNPPHEVGDYEERYLAGDELEADIIRVLPEAPQAKKAPQVAREIDKPVQTVRYRLSQLAAAGIVKCKWHRRFLLYYLAHSGSDVEGQREEKEKRLSDGSGFATGGSHV
ncbi:MAG: winged helix-turn-helix domain-containing protein [Halobacteriota archaeon]